MSAMGISRREMFRKGGLLASLAALPSSLRAASGVATPVAAAAGASSGRAVPDVYGPIGVRPLINARGTYTIISGSLMLPEVRAAIDAAAQHHVHLDELADAIVQASTYGLALTPLRGFPAAAGPPAEVSE